MSLSWKGVNMKYLVFGAFSGFLIGFSTTLDGLTIALLGGLVIFVVAALSPRLLLCLMLFLLPLIPLLVDAAVEQSIKESIVFIFFDLLILLSAISWLLPLSRITVDRSTYLATALFGTYLILSGVVSLMLGNSSGDIKSIFVLLHGVLPYFWFLTGGRFLAAMKHKRMLILSFIWGAVFSAIWYLWQIWGFVSAALPNTQTWGIVVASMNTNLNNLGLLYVVGIGFLIPISLRPWIKWTAASFLGVAVLYTFSRSSYLALLAVTAYYILSNPVKRLRPTALALLSVAIVAFLGIPQAFLERIQYTWSYGTGELDPSTTARLLLWQESFRAFLNNPLWGTGFASPPEFNIGDFGLEWSLSRLVFAHNYFLSLLSQTGLIGFILGTYVLFKGYVLSKRKEGGAEFNKSFRLTLVAILVASFFGEPLFWSGTLFLFMLLLSGVAYHAKSS